MPTLLRSLLTLTATLTLLPIAAPAQTLRGRVQEAASQQPIPAAEVTVLTEGGRVVTRVITDSLGNFHLAWTGEESVRVRSSRIGFRESTTNAFLVRRGEVVTVRILMSTSAIELDPLVISARNREGDIMGNFAAVERRKHLGFGVFVSRDDIRASGSSEISEVLTRVPGIALVRSQTDAHTVNAYSKHSLGATTPIRTGRGRRVTTTVTSCPMTLFLDGKIHRHPIAGVNVLPAHEIEVIEIYRGLAEVPAEFAGEHARCGVIAIWTTRRL
jgi:hypothetical protein